MSRATVSQHKFFRAIHATFCSMAIIFRAGFPLFTTHGLKSSRAESLLSKNKCSSTIANSLTWQEIYL